MQLVSYYSLMKKWTIIILLSALVIHCSDRKRANPIDPLNPDTRGKPTGLRICSEFSTIYLSWSSVNVAGLMGYRIYRKIEGDSVFRAIHVSPPDSALFVDRNVQYDVRHGYKIAALTEDYESPESDSVCITPGPTMIWFTDADDRRIISLSHDGLHEIDRLTVIGYPWDVVIHPRDRAIWFSDVLFGYIYRISGDEWEVYAPEDGWWEPLDMELDERRDRLWVADENGQVIQIQTLYADSVREIKHEEFVKPRSLCVIPETGDCWLADTQSLFRISGECERITMRFVHPMAIAADRIGRHLWLADSSRIVNLNYEGEFQFAIENNFEFVYAVAVDPGTGDLWAADGIGNTSLLKFDRAGNELSRVSGFRTPRALAVSAYDHSCVLADTENGRIVRISAQGEILSEIGGYYFPRGLFVEYKISEIE